MKKYFRTLFPLLLLALLSAGVFCACTQAEKPGANALSSRLSSSKNAGLPEDSNASSSSESTAGPGDSTLPSSPEKPLLSNPEDQLFPEAQALTRHLVCLVFTRDHIEKAQPLGDADIFRLMISLLVQEENSLSAFYPDCVSVGEDGVAVFPLESVQQLVGDIFGQGGWFLADPAFDAQQNAYLIPTGFGLGSVYSYEDLRLTWSKEDDTVTADFSLIDTPDFPGERRYGAYRITYQAVTEGGRTFLRYQGIQKTGD